MNGGYGRMLYNDKLGIRAYEYSQGSCLFAVVSLCEETALTNNKKSADMLGSIFDICKVIIIVYKQMSWERNWI
jgi:hypothetical protein